MFQCFSLSAELKRQALIRIQQLNRKVELFVVDTVPETRKGSEAIREEGDGEWVSECLFEETDSIRRKKLKVKLDF